MKKSLLIAIVLLPFTLVKAQIVLEHEYLNLVQPFHVDNYGYVYAKGYGNDSVIEIMSKDHLLLKTVNISEPDYILGGVFNVSDHLFNSDDKIEVMYSLYPSVWPNPLKLIIKNEDNIVIETFYDIDIDGVESPCIYNFDSEFKLKLLKSDNNQWITDIYSLPGSTILEIPKETLQNYRNSFPNPTLTEINFICPTEAKEIVIYGMNGAELYRKNVTGAGRERIDVSSFTSGIYLYKIFSDNSVIATGKFQVGK